jgi:hypothetical protein
LLGRLIDSHPDRFGFSVSHTTRNPRPGEVDGVHYNFCTKAEMEAAIERGEFIEHAHVHASIYGTSKEAIEAAPTPPALPNHTSFPTYFPDTLSIDQPAATNSKAALMAAP